MNRTRGTSKVSPSHAPILPHLIPGTRPKLSFRLSRYGIAPSRGDLGDLRIPVAMRPTAEQVIKLTYKVSGDLCPQLAPHDALQALRGETATPSPEHADTPA